jgi:hypothetical protein
MRRQRVSSRCEVNDSAALSRHCASAAHMSRAWRDVGQRKLAPALSCSQYALCRLSSPRSRLSPCHPHAHAASQLTACRAGAARGAAARRQAARPPAPRLTSVVRRRTGPAVPARARSRSPKPAPRARRSWMLAKVRGPISRADGASKSIHSGARAGGSSFRLGLSVRTTWTPDAGSMTPIGRDPPDAVLAVTRLRHLVGNDSLPERDGTPGRAALKAVAGLRRP